VFRSETSLAGRHAGLQWRFSKIGRAATHRIAPRALLQANVKAAGSYAAPGASFRRCADLQRQHTEAKSGNALAGVGYGCPNLYQLGLALTSAAADVPTNSLCDEFFAKL